VQKKSFPVIFLFIFERSAGTIKLLLFNNFLKKIMKKLRSFLLLFLVLAFSTTYANNLTITNVGTPTTTTVTFTITWDNSWRNATNYDALWVFVKKQVCGGATSGFDHADLSTTASTHTITNTSTTLTVTPTSDGKGVFIYRTANGLGNVTAETVTLTIASAYVIATTNMQVFGIEMVNVGLNGAAETFSVGDGTFGVASASPNTRYSLGSDHQWNGNCCGSEAGSGSPRSIANENAMAAGHVRNDGVTIACNCAGDGSITYHPALAAGFPKGYAAFYCMKYEISQSQWVAFLNVGNSSVQSAHTAVAPTSVTGTWAMYNNGSANGNILNRNGIRIQTAATAAAIAVYACDFDADAIYNETTDGLDIACNYLSWDDLKAYLDWAALRPMTELEFEKASRGPTVPVKSEYAWGNTTITTATTAAITNSGQNSEVSSTTGTGLCASTGGASASLGPFRCGFAATGITTRQLAGASYYGIMDLSANVWEQCIVVGSWTNPIYYITPIFTGVLGDGNLDNSGLENVTNWGAGEPKYSIVRGGNWEYTTNTLYLSDRTYIGSTTESATRTRRNGGRGVR